MSLPKRATRARAWWRLFLPGLLCVVSLALAPLVGAEEALYRGHLLVDVLKALQERGLKLVFSSTVVDDRMRVTVEPVATDPRAILEEILAPLGLRAEDGPDGVVLIVRAPGTIALAGRVVSSARGTPVAGAAVSIPGAQRMTTTGPDGGFLLRDVPPGPHDVVVEAAGFFPRTAAVDVRTPRTRDLLVGLEPRRDFVEEIVVTPGRVALLQQEDPSTVTLNDEDALLAPSFGGDVSRIVESLPGVAAPDNSAAFNVRGSLAQDVSYVLDGLELYEPYHLQQFQSPFSHLDTDIVDRINFLSGPFPADFGDRHGGIVQVTTRAPVEDARTLISVGNINSHISHSGRLPGRDASWLASLRAWYPEQFRESIEIGEPGLEPRFADAFVGATFVVSPTTVLSAHSLIATDEFDFAQGDDPQTADTQSSSGHFWARALHSWSQEIASETVVSGGWIDRFRGGISDPEDEVLLVEDERDTDFYGLKHDMTWRVSGANQVKGGIDLRYLKTDYDYTSGPVDDPASIVTLDPAPSGISYGLLSLRPHGLDRRFRPRARRALGSPGMGRRRPRQPASRRPLAHRREERAEARSGGVLSVAAGLRAEDRRWRNRIPDSGAFGAGRSHVHASLHVGHPLPPRRLLQVAGSSAAPLREHPHPHRALPRDGARPCPDRP